MIALAQAAPQAQRNLLQDKIAQDVPVRIVEGLELIQIEAKHCELASPPSHGNSLFHTFKEQRPVWQLGQCIMARQEHDAQLGLFTLRYVFVGSDPATVGHRFV